MRGTINGTTQGAVAAGPARRRSSASALLLWSAGQASAGDVTFVLTSFFVLQGYLRDIGTHIRNLQRSVNDMEELVDIHDEPLGIADRPGAGPIRIGDGGISFDNVTFHYGSHLTAALPRLLGVRSRRANASAWSAIPARARRPSSS